MIDHFMGFEMMFATSFHVDLIHIVLHALMVKEAQFSTYSCWISLWRSGWSRISTILPLFALGSRRLLYVAL